ncbi:MAG: glycosyltransferase [Candidatus Paceibacterota bacterium]
MREFQRMIRYGLVGVTGTLIDLAFLFILVEYFHLQVILAATISFILAATNNFVWNKIWTFNNKNKAYHHQYLKFLIISFIGLNITLLLMSLLHLILGLWYILAKIITSLLVLYWNYWGNKHWTFKVFAKKEFPEVRYDFDYTIVIPAYNEENRITKTLGLTDNFLRYFNSRCEIIVVNDGSNDNTSKIIDEITLSYATFKKIDLKKNQGKGSAIKIGIENSSGKYILFMDADGSTPIEELINLNKYFDEYDVVIGSRKLKSSVVELRQPLYRKIISKVGAILSSTLIRDIKDTQCGFKLIKSQVAKEIFSKQQIKRFGFDLEFLAISQFYDYKIIEVPIRWKNDRISSLRPVRDTLLTLWDFILIQYNFLRNKY